MKRNILVALIGLIACVSPASGQERMWFFQYRDGMTLQVTQTDVTDGGRTWTTSARWVISNRYAWTAKLTFAGGRYLAWLAHNEARDTVIAYLDTRTGQEGTIPGLLFGGGTGGTAASIAVDRRSGRLFVLDPRGIWVIDSTLGVRLIPMPSQIETRQLQAAAGRLFIKQWRGFDAPEVLVIDPDSGARLATFPRTWRVEFTRDERTFYLSSADGTLGWLYRHQAATLARVGAVRFGPNSTWIDGVRIVRAGSNDVSRVVVWDADGRNVLGEVLHGAFDRRLVEFWRPGARSPVYAQSYQRAGSYFYGNYRLDAIDPATFTIVHSVELGFPAAMLALPEPPSGLTATVLGRRVSLSWDAMEHAGDYEIEAGSAPGLGNLATFRTGGPAQLSVSNVPAGTYYVRVRAINELGRSNFSGELRIDVD